MANCSRCGSPTHVVEKWAYGSTSYVRKDIETCDYCGKTHVIRIVKPKRKR
jgi:ribosomal protein S14